MNTDHVAIGGFRIHLNLDTASRSATRMETPQTSRSGWAAHQHPREEERMMTASYSRRLPVCQLQDLAPGDLVDISASKEPSWAAVRAVGACEDDPSEDVECDGCEGVIFFANEDDGVLHVEWTEALFARFTADCGPAEIEAENEAQARAAHARYIRAATDTPDGDLRA